MPTGGAGITTVVNSPTLIDNSAENLQNMLALNPSELALGQARLALVGSMALLPYFSGDDPSVLFSNFLQSFNRSAAYFSWSGKGKMFALQQKLTGKAYVLVLVNTCMDQINTSDDTLRILKNRFSVVKYASEVVDKFWGFKQPEHLNVSDYIARGR